MAVTQLYTAVTGDTITAARWNNEFGNIYSNGSDIPFPLTKAVSLAGWTLTLDSAAVTSLISSAAAAFLFTPGVKTGTPGTNGSHFNIASATFTDNATAVSGTAALWTSTTLRRPTLAATNTGVTTTEATTLYIENAPAAGTNETLTNAYAIHVEDGTVLLDGALTVGGTTTLNGATIVEELNSDTLNSDLLSNCRINVTMSGSAVTVALKGVDGNDPSSTNKVRVRFRNATLATAGTTQVEVSAALSVAISSGSTLGTVSAQASRVYVGLLNNSGTAELFVYQPIVWTSDTLIHWSGLDEGTLLTTTAEGGAGGADTAQVTYSTTARTNVPFRIIGFFDSTQTTAGTWDTAAARIQDLQPWMPRTGHIVRSAVAQTRTTQYSGTFGTADAIPSDDTIPQISEGLAYQTVTITPTSATNILRFYHAGYYSFPIDANSDTWDTNGTTAVFQDSTANAIYAALITNVQASNATTTFVVLPLFLFYQLAGTTSSTTFTIRAGGTNGDGALAQQSFLGNINVAGASITNSLYAEVSPVGIFSVEEIMA